MNPGNDGISGGQDCRGGGAIGEQEIHVAGILAVCFGNLVEVLLIPQGVESEAVSRRASQLHRRCIAIGSQLARKTKVESPPRHSLALRSPDRTALSAIPRLGTPPAEKRVFVEMANHRGSPAVQGWVLSVLHFHRVSRHTSGTREASAAAWSLRQPAARKNL